MFGIMQIILSKNIEGVGKMLEIAEALVIARQLNDTIKGKVIKNVAASQSPHRFAWYHGAPEGYGDLLTGKGIHKAKALGGMVEITAGDVIMVFCDGAALRFHNINEKHPQKHQLLIEFDDGSALSVSIQMYGGLWCFKEGEFDNIYYRISMAKPSPLSDEFDRAYFASLITSVENKKLSVKAFLATEQRIPGLGNGVLQDILYIAKVHPRRKMSTLSNEDRENLFGSIKSTLKEMTERGGGIQKRICWEEREDIGPR